MGLIAMSAWAMSSSAISSGAGFCYLSLIWGGGEGRRPEDDYSNLIRELNLYKSELAEKPFLIAANKMDLPGTDETYREFIRSSKVPASRVFPISALESRGLTKLKEALFEMEEESLTVPEDPAVPLVETVRAIGTGNILR